MPLDGFGRTALPDVVAFPIKFLENVAGFLEESTRGLPLFPAVSIVASTGLFVSGMRPDKIPLL